MLLHAFPCRLLVVCGRTRRCCGRGDLLSEGGEELRPLR
jgi:hypothetical protein